MTILTGNIFYEPDATDIAETIRRSEGREIDDVGRLLEPSQRFELTPLDVTIRDLCASGI